VEERAQSGGAAAGKATAVSAGGAGVGAGAFGRSDNLRRASNSAWRAWSSARRAASRTSRSRRRASSLAARAEAAASLLERKAASGSKSLGFLGASGPGELKGTSTSCLSLGSGDAILLKAEGASGLLGGTSGFLSLVAASASRVLGEAAAPNVNNVGVLGTLLHKGVSPARRAEGSEDGRASVSEEKRLQYRQQGAASKRSSPGTAAAEKRHTARVAWRVSCVAPLAAARGAGGDVRDVGLWLGLGCAHSVFAAAEQPDSDIARPLIGVRSRRLTRDAGPGPAPASPRLDSSREFPGAGQRMSARDRAWLCWARGRRTAPDGAPELRAPSEASARQMELLASVDCLWWRARIWPPSHVAAAKSESILERPAVTRTEPSAPGRWGLAGHARAGR
jgi:hypothetical protein